MRRYGQLSVVARALMQHALISVAALVLVGASAAFICVRLVQNEALRQAETNGSAIAFNVVAPRVTPQLYTRNPAAVNRLDEQVRLRMADNTIQRVKVWSPEGVILYCDDPRQLGLKFPLLPDDLALLAKGGVDSDISDLDKSENTLDRGFGQSLEVYAGAKDTAGRPILVETYFTTTQLHSDEHAMIQRIIPVVAIAVLVLGLLLVPLAFSLARRAGRYEQERLAMIRFAVEASSAERRRVAGELHDGVIQDLAGVGYALSALDSQLAGLSASHGSSSVGAIQDTVRATQRLVHDDVLALRELTGLQYAVESGAADPAAALDAIADEVRADGTPVQVVVGELPELPPEHRAALIRVGREALCNAGQHARGANVVLRLGVQGNRVVVSVADDGPGFDPGSAPGPVDGHMGLAMLVDAADGVGGYVELRSRRGRGTTVRMSLPLPTESGAAGAR